MLSQAGMAVGLRLVALCSSSEACWLWPLYMAARPHILQSRLRAQSKPLYLWGAARHLWDMTGQNAPPRLQTLYKSPPTNGSAQGSEQSLGEPCCELR